MKLIIKNLKQVTYEVEVPSEKSTVLDLKKAIETAHNFDSTSLKLLIRKLFEIFVPYPDLLHMLPP